MSQVFRDDFERATASDPVLLNAWDDDNPYELDEFVAPTAWNGLYYICTRAGGSGLVEPVWPAVIGEPVDDPDGGGCQWTCRGADPGWDSAPSVTGGATYALSASPVIHGGLSLLMDATQGGNDVLALSFSGVDGVLASDHLFGYVRARILTISGAAGKAPFLFRNPAGFIAYPQVIDVGGVLRWQVLWKNSAAATQTITDATHVVPAVGLTFEIEFEWKRAGGAGAGDVDGIVRLWVNRELFIEKTDCNNFGALTLSNVWLRVVGSTANTHKILYDEFRLEEGKRIAPASPARGRGGPPVPAGLDY